MPSWTSRANLCSQYHPSRRTRRAALCCKARACCNMPSWGWISTRRPFLPLADALGALRSIPNIPPRRTVKAAIDTDTTGASVRGPAGTMAPVTCPAGAGATARGQVKVKVIFGEVFPVGPARTLATNRRPASAKVWLPACIGGVAHGFLHRRFGPLHQFLMPPNCRERCNTRRSKVIGEVVPMQECSWGLLRGKVFRVVFSREPVRIGCVHFCSCGLADTFR